jgi:hypothetical protein
VPAGALALQELAIQLRRLERGVAHRHQDRLHVIRERLDADANRVGSATLWLLSHRGGAAPHGRLDRVGPVSGHHHRTAHARHRERVEHVVDHRAAGQRMEDLRDARAHAGTLAGGQDDGRGGGQL